MATEPLTEHEWHENDSTGPSYHVQRLYYVNGTTFKFVGVQRDRQKTTLMIQALYFKPGVTRYFEYLMSWGIKCDERHPDTDFGDQCMISIPTLVRILDGN